MRVAILQSAAAGQTPEARLALLGRAAEAAAADLILCPELFLSGYAAGDDVRRFAEPADGESARAVAAIAQASQTAIVYGYPERAGDDLYNAAMAIDANGAVLGNHRKLALPPGFEADLFRTGAALTLFEAGGLRFAILICYDAEFPETVRAAAAAGADAILVPTALGRQWSVVSERVMPARAFENGVYLLYANHSGAEGAVDYLGGSCVLSPEGADLARAGADEAMISAELDPARVAAAQTRLPYLRDVQPLKARLNGG